MPMPTDDAIARERYEVLRERYGSMAFRPWEELHQIIREHHTDFVRGAREGGHIHEQNWKEWTLS